MDTMQFRDYVFAHNPANISVTHAAGLVSHFCPGKGEIQQDLGPKARTVRCGGSFFADTPEEAVAQAETFRQSAGEEAGMLYLPGTAPFPARLRDFVVDYAGDGRILPYTMVFVEEVAP